MAKKTTPTSKRGEIARLAKQIADHQARIQVIAANWGAEINEILTASERAFLSKLAKMLKDFEFHPNALKTLSDLRKICRELTAIRQAAYARAEKKIAAEAKALAENESKWAKGVTKELSEPGTKFADPSAAALDKVVRFGLANGATMSEYFSKVAADDAARIESTIRQGVESGWTIDQMARNIAGSAANDYKDGIFETSRRSAVNMARTLTNAISNNAKETFYRENADILEGVEILATLDGRTCPVCASVDRKRYKFDEPHPALPIHHQCRCVLLPVTPLSDLVEESRPMAKADFMKEAERLYKAKYPNKDFAALADSTKKKYYYEAMREYERRTGEPAYTQVSGGVSFKDYFENHMTAQQQKDWLGPQRYKLYKDYKLPLDRFIPPYPNKRMTIVELKEQDKASFAAVNAPVPKPTKAELHQKHLEKRKKQLKTAFENRVKRWQQAMLDQGGTVELAEAMRKEYTLDIAKKYGKPPAVKITRKRKQTYYNSSANPNDRYIQMHRDPQDWFGYADTTFVHEFAHWKHHMALIKKGITPNDVQKIIANDIHKINKWIDTQKQQNSSDFDLFKHSPHEFFAQKAFGKSFYDLDDQQKFVSVAYADCIGEMTIGKYGGGHTTAYYKAKNKSAMCFCESIANIKVIKKYSKNIGEPFDFLNTADILKTIGE